MKVRWSVQTASGSLLLAHSLAHRLVSVNKTKTDSQSFARRTTSIGCVMLVSLLLASISAAQIPGISAQQNALATYTQNIRAKVKSNLTLPPDVKGNPEVVFRVIVSPTGEVLSVVQKKSSGNSAYDLAIEQAIKKSSPFKRSVNVSYEPELIMTFRPFN